MVKSSAQNERTMPDPISEPFLLLQFRSCWLAATSRLLAHESDLTLPFTMPG